MGDISQVRVLVSGPRGPRGVAGPAGATGSVGAVGATGATGATGAQGPQGLQGLVGPQGPQGVTGSVGPTGATGQGADEALELIDRILAAGGKRYSVTDKGAKLNGGDDYQAVADTISEAAANGGGIITIPAGELRGRNPTGGSGLIDLINRNNIVVMGAGPEATIIKPLDGHDNHAVQIGGGSRIALLGMTLDGNRSGAVSVYSGGAINAGSSTFTASAGIFTTGDIGRNIVIQGAGVGGAALNGIIQTRVNANTITLSDPLGRPAVVTLLASTTVTDAAFTISGVRHGLRVSGTDLRIANLDITNTGSYGIGGAQGSTGFLRNVSMSDISIYHTGDDCVDIKNNVGNYGVRLSNFHLEDPNGNGIGGKTHLDMRGPIIASNIYVYNLTGGDTIGIRYRLGDPYATNGDGGHAAVLSNFYVYGAYQSGDETIGLVSNCRDIQLSNGTIWNCRDGAVLSSSDSGVSNVLALECARYGVRYTTGSVPADLSRCVNVRAIRTGYRTPGPPDADTRKTITNMVDNGLGAIRVTVTAHVYATDDLVRILSVSSSSTVEANDWWFINVIDADTFDLVGSTFINPFTSGGTVMKCVKTGDDSSAGFFIQSSENKFVNALVRWSSGYGVLVDPTANNNALGDIEVRNTLGLPIVDNGYNTTSARSIPARAAAGRKVIAVGDQLIRHNHLFVSGATPSFSSHARGELVQAQALSGGRFVFDAVYDPAFATAPYNNRAFTGLNYGISSSLYRANGALLGVSDQIDAAIKANPRVIFVSFGSGDITAGRTQKQITDNMTEAAMKITMAGIVPIFATIPPRPAAGWPGGAAQARLMRAVNSWMRNTLTARPGVLVFDRAALMTDPTSSTGEPRAGWFASDNQSFTNVSGYYLGAALADLIAPLMPPAIASQFDAADVYLNPDNPFGNLAPNPGLFGTAGAKGSGASGDVPDSWRVQRTSGATSDTVVCSVTSDAASGNSIQMSIATTGTSTAGTTALFQFYPSTEINVAAFAGQWVQCAFAVDAAASAILNRLDVFVSDVGNNIEYYGNRSFDLTTPMPNVQQKRVVMSPPIKLGSNATTLNCRLGVGIFTQNDGSIVVRANAPSVRPIPDPYLNLFR